MPPEVGSPHVSVIVPVFGDGAALDRCVGCLLAQGYPPELREVIVVDNGSSPPVVPRWGPGVTVVVEERVGSYAARARGVAASTGEVLAFTDADCEPCPDWLQHGVAALRSMPVPGVVAGRVELVTGTRPSIAELFELRYGFQQHRYLEEGFGVTANLFVDRAAFEGAGGFDTSLRSGGDREFGQRAQGAGVPLAWSSAAAVRHPARSTVRAQLKKARRTAGGTVQLELRSSRRHVVLMRTLWFLRPPLREARDLLRGDGPLTARFGVTLLLLLVRWTTALERARVMATGRSVR